MLTITTSLVIMKRNLPLIFLHYTRLSHQFKTIKATATADFDGDGWTDVLLVCGNHELFEGTIVWGSEHTLSGDHRSTPAAT